MTGLVVERADPADTVPVGGDNDDEPRSGRRPARRTVLIWGARLALLVGLLVGWELFSNPRGSRWTLIDKYDISEPSDIWTVLRRWTTDGTLWRHTWVTVQEMSLGFAIGAALGLVVGVLLGVSRNADAVLRPFVNMLYSVPRLALAPLFLVWFGLGMSSKVLFVVVIVMFMVFYNTVNGVRNVDRELIDVLRVLGASRLQVHRVVTIPAATSWIITGLSISAPLALVGAVTAEMISSNRGLGFLLIRSYGQFNTAGVFAAIVTMVVLALLVQGIVAMVEHRALRWRPTEHR